MPLLKTPQPAIFILPVKLQINMDYQQEQGRCQKTMAAARRWLQGVLKYPARVSSACGIACCAIHLQSCSQGVTEIRTCVFHLPQIAPLASNCEARWLCSWKSQKRVWESMVGKRKLCEDFTSDYPCRLKRQETWMALLIQEAADGTSYVSLGYSAQSTSSCCFGPSQSQTVQPKLDTASRPWVPKPSILNSETCLTDTFLPGMLQMP